MYQNKELIAQKLKHLFGELICFHLFLLTILSFLYLAVSLPGSFLDGQKSSEL